MNEDVENKKIVADGEAARADQTSHVVKGQGETILLADHDTYVLDTYSRILDRLGYRVLVASSVPDAVHLHKAHCTETDLLILDCTMPWFTANQPLQAMRKISPETRAIFVTGYYENCPVKPDGNGEAGSDQVLLKPFSIVELSLAIRRALGR